MPMNIACITSEPAVLEAVRAACAAPGAGACTHFPSEVALLRALPRQRFDLIVLDFAAAPAPDDAILSWLNWRAGSGTPVLCLTPLRDAALTALVLDSGADDLLARPFDPVELGARARALVRRSNPQTSRRKIELAGFALDRDHGSFAFHGVPIPLTPREFSLAWMLFSSLGAYISRDAIGSAIWGADSDIAGRTIEQHVYQLRKKLQLGPERGVVIRTVYGKGYRLGLSAQGAPGH